MGVAKRKEETLEQQRKRVLSDKFLVSLATEVIEAAESELRTLAGKPCTINVLARSAILLKARVNCASEGIIVLNEYFDGNWRAYINGEDLRIYNTSINQNGVYIQPGIQNLEFKYRPADFQLGILISFLNSFLIILVFLITKFSRKRSFLKLPLKPKYLRETSGVISIRVRRRK